MEQREGKERKKMTARSPGEKHVPSVGKKNNLLSEIDRSHPS
jgi:hypothetical protein